MPLSCLDRTGEEALTVELLAPDAQFVPNRSQVGQLAPLGTYRGAERVPE